MSIPLTCPGCSVAFEVPDNLAGKTIRCTGCKTQVTVPAAGQAAATGKKPFGWAGSAAPAPAPKGQTAAPEPLPLDDDDTPAPAKTSATAKPPAKAASKPAVAVAQIDDDEDDAPKKKSSSGSATKAVPVVKGSPKKRPIDDDDEDDDDDSEDNDHPRTKRKSQKKSGSDNTGLIVMLGGGALAVAAVVGLCVWLFTGDKKKDDTASSGSSGGSSSPTMTMPGTGTPGTPGTPGSGGTTPVSANGWQTFTVAGFSAELPGTPQKMDVPGGAAAGLTMTMYVLESSAKDSGYLIMVMDLPMAIPKEQIPKFFDEFVKGARNGGGFGGGFGGARGGKSDVTVGTPRDFTQDGFPGRELPLVNKAGASVGQLRAVISGSKVYVYGYGADKGLAGLQPSFDKFVSSVKISANGAGNNNIAMGGPNAPGMMPGMGPTNPGIATPPGMGISQPPLNPGMPPGGIAQPPLNPGNPAGPPMPMNPGVNPPMFQPMPMNPGFNPGNNNPPFQPGGNPVGPGPGPGMQPGFGPGGQPGFGPGNDPNAAPAGVNADGNSRIVIPSFFTAAFDEQNNAFYTITFRQDKGRTLGLLRAYEYPTFAKQGSYKIPHLGTRAVVDSTKRLLYVATSNNPTGTVAQQQFDLAVATGDVHVFDLNMLKSGGVPDEGELKPVATITIGKPIRGLELSPDGSALFVATSSQLGGKVKSYLYKIDTGTRKQALSKENKPIWEMRKSADGKNLLVLESPTGPGEGSTVRVVSQENLTPIEGKSYSLQGVANHIAAAPGGQIAATLASTTPNGPTRAVLANEIGQTQDLDLGRRWRATRHAYYIEYSPDGKLLFMSPHRAKGVDVYEVSDPASPTGLTKKASITTANNNSVGGHFFISPDGKFFVEHHGVVIDTSNFGGNNGEATGDATGFAPPGGGIGPNPGGMPPGGPFPGPMPGIQPGVQPQPGVPPGFNPMNPMNPRPGVNPRRPRPNGM